MRNKLYSYALVLALLFTGFACKTKDDLEAFKNAEYSLKHVDKVLVNGVDLLNKQQPEDFSFRDAAVLFKAFSENKLNATSTIGLNVALGKGNESRTMQITQMKWQLLLNDEKAMSGIINEPVELHNGLNTITVQSPLAFEQNGEGGSLNNLFKLASMLQRSQDNKVRLQIKPTILTSVGPFELPTYINIK